MKKYFPIFVAVIFIGVIALIPQRHRGDTPLGPVINTATTTPAVAETATSAPPVVEITHETFATASETKPEGNVTLVAGTSTYRLFAPAGSNVADAMLSLAEKGGFSFTSHEYSGLGIFIDSINGISGSGGKYWFLYINGKSSETGPSQTVLKDGDVIEWRFTQAK